MNIWSVLKIDPTKEERAIKKAYAAILKTIDREKSPEEFQTLRKAFEEALAYTKQDWEWEDLTEEEDNLEAISIEHKEEIEDLKDNSEYPQEEKYYSKQKNDTYQEEEDEFEQDVFPSLKNKIDYQNTIEANRIVRELINLLKEEGEEKAVIKWNHLENELKEYTFGFLEEFNLSLRNELELLYSDGMPNDEKFPFRFLEKVFSYFEWNDYEEYKYYSLTIIKRKISARRERIRLEKEILKNKRLAPLLEPIPSDPSNIRTSRLQILNIQKYIEHTQAKCPELFDYEIDSNIVDYWMNAKKEMSKIWILAFIGLPMLAAGVYKNGSVFLNFTVIPALFFFWGKSLREIIYSYICFFYRLFLSIDFDGKKNRGLIGLVFAILGTIVFSEVFAIASLQSSATSFFEILLRFIGVILFTILFAPIFDLIIQLFYHFSNAIFVRIPSIRLELWFAGVFLLFLLHIYLGEIDGSRLQNVALLVLLIVGFDLFLSRDKKEIFFLEIYTTFLLAPTTGYYLYLLFGWKSFSAIGFSVASLLAISNFEDVYSTSKIKISGRNIDLYLVFAAILVSIGIIFYPEIPALIIAFLLFFILQIRVTFLPFWQIYWSVFVTLGLFLSPFVRKYIPIDPKISPLLLQLTLFSISILLGKIKWRKRFYHG
ncbi:MAG TPA: hypothetical protein PK079_22950 [Leptospiraceae bacterium]|nr:hypothetical protein [Leptospiraceae bacterium]HMW05404.1 hypothetical protein [Leptospiraceae bacterium]HMX32848.1 hypothetical protein [Leptospiraceae bacterium]HMY33888.1 hypothetical protein [Leptospiraceae bacterium]HMZ64506.1 hypothetical protein [Leptospiraceae bacterium]